MLDKIVLYHQSYSTVTVVILRELKFLSGLIINGHIWHLKENTGMHTDDSNVQQERLNIFPLIIETWTCPFAMNRTYAHGTRAKSVL